MFRKESTARRSVSFGVLRAASLQSVPWRCACPGAPSPWERQRDCCHGVPDTRSPWPEVPGIVNVEVCIRVRMDSDSHWYVRANSVNDPGSSDDRGHHGRAARGWDLGDTRRAVPQQGGGATPAPESRPALRRYCPREPADPAGEMSALRRLLFRGRDAMHHSTQRRFFMSTCPNRYVPARIEPREPGRVGCCRRASPRLPCRD